MLFFRPPTSDLRPLTSDICFFITSDKVYYVNLCIESGQFLIKSRFNPHPSFATLFKRTSRKGAKKGNAWFPCSSVGTHMVCIPTLEHGNEKKKPRLGVVECSLLGVRFFIRRWTFDVRCSSFFCAFAPLREIFLSKVSMLVYKIAYHRHYINIFKRHFI